jgi:hypothetical protein
MLFAALILASPTCAAAQDVPSFLVTRVFAGGGPVFGTGDVPATAPIQSKPAFALGLELSIAAAEHVEIGVGAVQLWSSSYRNGPHGELAGRSWSVLTGYAAVHYHVVDSALVGLAVGPVVSIARREVFSVPSDDGSTTTLVSAGGSGAGFETRVAFPGGRCKNTYSFEAAMQYAAFRWVADGTRLDQRPLTFTLGVVIRH